MLHESTRLTCPLFRHLKHVGCPNKNIGGIFYLGRTPPIKHKTEVFTLVTVLLIVTDKTNVLDEVHMIWQSRCVADFYPNSEPKNPLEEFSFFSASSINSRPFASLSAIVMWLKMSQNGEYCVYFYICVTPLFTIDIIIIIWIRRNLLEMFKYMQSICVQSTLMARVVLKRNGNWR